MATTAAKAETANERPIIFGASSIKSILSGSKTQTRRVVKPQPDEMKPLGDGGRFIPYRKTVGVPDMPNAIVWKPIKCSYGKPSDRLLCYNCFHGQTNNTETDSGITERRLHGGFGRASLQPNTICGLRTQGASGLVSTEGTDTQRQGVRNGHALSREQARHEVGSSFSVHGLSRDAAQGQTGDAAQGRRQGQQQADESLLGLADRKLARQAGARNGNGGRESLGGEVHERGTAASSVGDSEGALQPEAGGACTQCQLVVDKRYRSGGTLLWVRESFYAYGHFQYTGQLTKTGKREIGFIDLTLRSNLNYFYSADSPAIKTQSNKFDVGWHRRPSIFMPRWASRLTLEITDVRVERLQEISIADIQAEGVLNDGITFEPGVRYPLRRLSATRDLWMIGWDKINAKRGYSWASNPWVWVIEFKRIEQPSR